MLQLDVNLDSDGCWKDLAELGAVGKVIPMVGDKAPPIRLAYLKGGMISGKGSVSIRIELPGGYVLITETSLALFLRAADIMRAAELRGTGAGPSPGRDG